MSDHDILLEIEGLETRFDTDAGVVRAVDGVSLTVRCGRTTAVVGESGCGKTVTALSIMRLIPSPPGRIAAGRVMFHDGQADGPCDLLGLDEGAMRRIRGNRIAMVFQEPMSSLNPVFSVGDQVAEAVTLHRKVTRRQAIEVAVEMLERVGLPDARRRAREYPHELSGGMRQRVMIAMAMCCQPSVLIADEPTTALDVTVQAQILELFSDVQRGSGMGILIITHDLGVVAEIADDVCVMYAGKIVERATAVELFHNPLHPYTQGLLRALPRISTRCDRLEVIPGQVPHPLNHPKGCRFHPRCDESRRRAADGERPWIDVGSDGEPIRVLRRCVEPTSDGLGGDPALNDVGEGHFVACWEVDRSVAATPVVKS